MSATTTATAVRGHRAAAPAGADTAARVVLGSIAVIVAISVVIQLTLLFTGGQDANSGASGAEASLATRLVRFFSYFTIQSNLFILGTSIALMVNPRRDGMFWRIIRLDAILGITITGIVYDTILAPLVHLEGWALAATIGFHYIAPWATVLAWLILGPRPRMGWRTFGLAFIWPVLWLGYTFIHGAVTSWYPYPFLNVTKIGYSDSIRNSLLVLAIAVVLAVVYVVLDKKLPAVIRDDRRH